MRSVLGVGLAFMDMQRGLLAGITILAFLGIAYFSGHDVRAFWHSLGHAVVFVLLCSAYRVSYVHLKCSSYKVPFSHTLYRQMSFFPRMLHDWNKLPDSVLCWPQV